MAEENKKKEVNKDTSKNEQQPYYFGGISEYKLEDIEAEVLNDNVYLDVFAGSDVRFKEDVKNLTGALNLISNLDVYQYQYNKNQFPDKNLPSGEHIGLMAQDLEKVLPHLVKEDSDGYKYVNYSGLSPLLLSAIKDLISIINKQTETIHSLEESIKKLQNNK